MTMRKPTMLALAALLLCSACADKPTTKTALTTTYQQYSQVHVDEMIVPPTQMARVGNQGLIMMR